MQGPVRRNTGPAGFASYKKGFSPYFVIASIAKKYSVIAKLFDNV
jgi:hypothetical protein